jgi:L-serine dehydratase
MCATRLFYAGSASRRPQGTAAGAAEIYQRLTTDSGVFGGEADPLAAMDWVTLWAPAVNEENASGGRVNGALGAIYQQTASISGAEVGCQGEVGTACSMAADALAEILGGTPEQVENAAEIGMEHHLGLTCDPVGGLVQIPY